MVIVPTVNITEELYTKLSDISKVSKSLRLCVKEDAFIEFHKVVHNSTELGRDNEVNAIITIYSTVYLLWSRCKNNTSWI